jgi:type I restriction enzyme M protein
MFATVGEKVFPFLRNLGGDGFTYGEHMKDARFTIPMPQLLSRVVDLLDEIPMNDRDTNGDLYEYLLSNIASAGVNGQFRTPRHIIKLMVDMTAPTPTDEICDPASGTAGFLVAASEYIRDQHPSGLTDAVQLNTFTPACFTATTSTTRCDDIALLETTTRARRPHRCCGLRRSPIRDVREPRVTG